MKFRNLDENGDWEFGRGIGSYSSEDAAISLDIATSLRSWNGNCFFDLEKGVDYLNLFGPGEKDALDAAIQGVIMGVDGVIAINSYKSVFDSTIRKLSVPLSIQTIYSPSFLAHLQLLASPIGA